MGCLLFDDEIICALITEILQGYLNRPIAEIGSIDLSHLLWKWVPFEKYVGVSLQRVFLNVQSFSSNNAALNLQWSPKAELSAQQTISVARYLNPAGGTLWWASSNRRVRIQARITHDAVNKVINDGGDAVNTAKALIKTWLILGRHGIPPQTFSHSVASR
jgi:hypothetical protein